MSRLLGLLALSLTLVTVGCKKEGAIGPKGETGANGSNGTNGVDGINGSNGTNGSNGANGQDGSDGSDGQDGANGSNGTNGQDGADGQDGTPGPDATTFNFNLTFDATTAEDAYTGITGFDSGDVILTFANIYNLGSDPAWTQLPAVSSGVSFLSIFSVTTAQLTVLTEYVDGTAGSPWNSTLTLPCKAVLIKSTGLAKHPNLDLSSYTEVAEAFDL